jgi:hypothetical protein
VRWRHHDHLGWWHFLWLQQGMLGLEFLYATAGLQDHWLVLVGLGGPGVTRENAYIFESVKSFQWIDLRGNPPETLVFTRTYRWARWGLRFPTELNRQIQIWDPFADQQPWMQLWSLYH